MNWIDANITKPEPVDKFNDSDYVLCCDIDFHENSGSLFFVAWYSHNQKELIVSHYTSRSEPVKVTHWCQLPNKPKQ